MPVFVDPDSGKRYNNVPEDQVKTAQEKYGLVPLADYELQQEKGGFLGNAEAALVSIGRPIASGVAAAVRGVSSLGGEVDAMGNPVESTPPVVDVHGQDLAPGLYNESANRAVEANPTTAALARSVPMIAGSIAAAPATGGGSLLAAAGLDIADAAAQAAVDADLQGRDIDGTDVLRNAALNLVFSGAGHAIPAAAKATLRTGEDLLQGAAKTVVGKLEDLGKSKLAARVEETVADADKALDSVKLPRVLNNRGGQRDALELLGQKLEKSDPDVSKQLLDMMNGTGKSRYTGLTQLRGTLEDGSAAAQAIDEILPRKDLWGQNIVDHVANLEAARAARPPTGSTPDVLASYAETLRKFSNSKLEKTADLIDELAATNALQPLADKASQIATGAMAGKVARTASGVAGGLIGGWPGYMIGEGVGEALAPSLNKVTSKAAPVVSDYIVKAANGLKQFAENDRRVTARLLVDPVAAGKFSRVLGNVPSPMARFQGDDEHPEQAYQRWQATLDKYKRDPNSMIDALNQEFTGVVQQSPYMQKQLAAQAFKIYNFLQDKIPGARGKSIARPNGTPVSPLQLRTFALYATAAVDPASVLQDAKLGRLRREQVETLKALWPKDYEGLRNEVVQQLANGRSTTTTRQRMNLLFGFGSSIDPALGPTVSKIINAARDAQKQPSGGSSGISASTPPSIKSQVPAGESALQLGPSLDG